MGVHLAVELDRVPATAAAGTMVAGEREGVAMNRLNAILFVFPLLVACAAPADPIGPGEPLGSAAQRLCANPVVLARGKVDDAVVFDAQVAENEGSGDTNFGDATVMSAGLYNGVGTERDTFIDVDHGSLPAWSTCSSAVWTFYPGPVNKPSTGTLRLRSLRSPGFVGPAAEDSITWNNQPSDDGLVRGSLAITGSEPSWSIDVTAYYRGVLGGTITDHGLIMDKTDGGSGYGATTQMCSSESVTKNVPGCHVPTLTLCP
jgi:hypothetical protein